MFVHEDVAAGKPRQETFNRVTDGLQLLPCNVMLIVLGAPKSSSREVLVRDRAPSIARAVRV
jgi:hypothetical protein